MSQSHTASGALKAGSVGPDELQSGAVTSAHLASGAVTKSTVGLGSVDNTSDLGKPISTATQTALDAKLATTALDAQTAARIEDSGSATAAALLASYVRFVDQDGDPLPPGSLTTIHVNTVTGEIDDITFEEA